jgi:hypothetical protein
MKRILLLLFGAILGCNSTRVERPAEMDAARPMTSARVAQLASIDAGDDAARDASLATSGDVHAEGTVRFLIERVDTSHERGQQSTGPYDLVMIVEATNKKPERRHLHCPPRKRLMWENCDTYKSCEVIDSSNVICDGARFVLRTREGKTQVVRGENVELTFDHPYEVGEARTRVRVAFVDL